jgi:hypothetical protein
MARHKELIAWVKKARASGLTDQQIYLQLRKSRWPDTVIAETITSTKKILPKIGRILTNIFIVIEILLVIRILAHYGPIAGGTMPRDLTRLITNWLTSPFDPVARTLIIDDNLFGLELIPLSKLRLFETSIIDVPAILTAVTLLLAFFLLYMLVKTIHKLSTK